jgi:SAM-dependent methyltransferase
MSELCKLGEKYYVDKTPMFGGHTYTPQYNTLLSPIRKSVKLVLEIGIGTFSLMSPLTNQKYLPGASLRMWRDYFSEATIVGCDIERSVLFSEDRIKTFYVDQSNSESLNALISHVTPIEKFADIIIDDGSHIEHHMTLSFNVLWKLLKPGGIYIIEDIIVPRIDIHRIINLKDTVSDAEVIKVYKGINDGDNFVVFKKTM